MVSSGSGEGALDLGEGYAIKFISLNDKFLQVVLLDYGKEVAMPKQTWQKSKVVKKTIVKEKIVKVKEKPKEEQIKFTTNEEVGDMFD